MEINAPPLGQDVKAPPAQEQAEFPIPVMKDVGKEDGIVSGRPRILEHVRSQSINPILQPVLGYILLGYLTHWRKIEDGEAHPKIAVREGTAEAARAATHIQKAFHSCKNPLARQPPSQKAVIRSASPG